MSGLHRGLSERSRHSEALKQRLLVKRLKRFHMNELLPPTLRAAQLMKEMFWVPLVGATDFCFGSCYFYSEHSIDHLTDCAPSLSKSSRAPRHCRQATLARSRLHRQCTRGILPLRSTLSGLSAFQISTDQALPSLSLQPMSSSLRDPGSTSLIEAMCDAGGNGRRRTEPRHSEFGSAAWP